MNVLCSSRSRLKIDQRLMRDFISSEGVKILVGHQISTSQKLMQFSIFCISITKKHAVQQMNASHLHCWIFPVFCSVDEKCGSFELSHFPRSMVSAVHHTLT